LAANSKITFVNSQHAPVEVACEQNLSESLNSSNSPVLFGCRTGVCGACVVKIHSGIEQLDKMSAADEEVVLVMVDDPTAVRLGCQLYPKGDLEIEFVGKK
jgi:ferredoxin